MEFLFQSRKKIGDYEAQGYVVWEDEEHKVYLGSYSHCSCYDTRESIERKGFSGKSWEWSGTMEELLVLAKRKGCPIIEGREASPNDIYYDELMEIYDNIIKGVSTKES